MAVRTYLKHTPSIDASTFVDETAVVIGNVKIGKDSSIWPMVTIRGDMHQITIGDRTSIQDSSVLHITHAGKYTPLGYPLLIGSNVTVGHKVTLHGCTINDDCIIGIDSTVLDGAVIESNVILGAGSLVPPGKVLESGFLWLGSPVKKKRPLTEKEMEFIQYSADNYVKLKNNYM